MPKNFQDKMKKIAMDYDGVADRLDLPKKAVIITGRTEKDEQELREKVGKRDIHFFPDNKEHTDKNVADFKAKTINKLGIDTYYEDTPAIVTALRKKTDAEIVKVDTLTYVPGVLNIIFFSSDGIGFSVADKLFREGNNVVISFVYDLADVGVEGEQEEEKRRRHSIYEGVLFKHDSRKILKLMEKLENKEDWIVYCDFNGLAPLAEKALEMGFTKGFFPTMADLELEKDRDKAKDIVKEFYKDLDVAEVHDFSKAQDGIQFLQETEQMWVLKGNGDSAKTIVPYNNDPELSKQILIDALEAHTKEYEEGGFILEEKIVDGYELTPQIVFLDGKVVFTDIDIENKPVCAGNISVQTGAMQTLVIKTDLEDKINKMAFPKWIYDRAKEHKGLFVFDAGIICKDDKYYFTEFCSQRFGYDSWFVEVTMAHSATEFFTDLFNGKNPLKDDFGIATRGMNLHKDGKERRVLEGVSIICEDPEHTFVFECKKEDEKLVCTGNGWDLVVFTGSGKTVNEATEKAYKASEKFAFEDLYIRPKFDLLSFDYVSSIPNRFTNLNHKLFEATDMEDVGDYEIKSQLQEMKDKLNKVYEKE